MQDVRMCPECGSDEIMVTDTRYGGMTSDMLLRRRKCRKCGKTYKTVEIMVTELEELREKVEINAIENIRELVELGKALKIFCNARR